ncbi:MAG: hypothetical protein Q8S33_25850 [Myxococcales bacterium]|nr:hypothetical protein [Myxococcales bacterium]MDP3503787.1 hypothetical protein [Myxococcales bacterium]
MPTPPKKPDAKKTEAKTKPAPKTPAAKAATNPFLALHPPRSGHAGAGLSRGTKRGNR